MYKKLTHIIFISGAITIGIGLLAYATIWAFSFQKYPVSYGVSFSPEYSLYLGLDWKETFNAIIDDLQPQSIRIAAPMTEVEATRDHYSFETVDYMMGKAQTNNTGVILAVGQKLPRWPECYFPEWYKKILSAEERQTAFLSYVEKTVNRYKDNPVLKYWQVENEAYIKFDFGECEEFDKDLVQKEIALVHKLDPSRKIIITDSGELSLWYEAAKNGDILGSTLYRTVISKYGFTWKYWYLPAGFYRARARILGKDSTNFIISELQAEPWMANGMITATTTDSFMPISQIRNNAEYAEYVGASEVYFWGAEWWYWMKTKHNNPSFWNLAKEIIRK